MTKRKRIESFNFKEGTVIQDKFIIGKKIGNGWESEVYRVKEKITGIERAAKFFYPHRNCGNKAAKFHATKLFKLKNCSILIQYISAGIVEVQNHEVTYLISDYVEGEVLEDFLKSTTISMIFPCKH